MARKSKVKPVTLDVKVDPLAILLIIDEHGPCNTQTVIDELKKQYNFKTDAEFQHATDYCFTSHLLANLLLAELVTRKYTNAKYLFSVTARGKAEIDKRL